MRGGIPFLVTSVRQKIIRDEGNVQLFIHHKIQVKSGSRSEDFCHRENVKRLIGIYLHRQQKAQLGSQQTNMKSLLTLIHRLEKTQYKQLRTVEHRLCTQNKFDLYRECKNSSPCKKHTFVPSFLNIEFVLSHKLKNNHF